jgi:septum formation protein
VILASESPRRLQLLRSVGLVVTVTPSGYEEGSAPGLAPAQLAAAHAREKLSTVLRQRDGACDAPVIAADTVVDIDGLALGKPRDAAEAVGMLERLSGREHLVHSAFALAVPGAAEWTQEHATTRVRFYPLDAQEIAEYVAGGEPFDKAGGYGIQGRAAALVESIDGDFYTVMGLPLGQLLRTLRRLGFVLPKTNSKAV